MTARLSPLLYYSVCLALFLGVSSVFSAEYQGPVFPSANNIDVALISPPPLPRQDSLLQRPKNKQVVFNELDPVGSVIPQDIFFEEDFDILPMPAIRQNRIQNRSASIIDGNVIFVDDGEYAGDNVRQLSSNLEGEVAGEYPFEMGGYFAGPVPMTFGMSLFDNLSLFAESTTFKTELSEGRGSYGLGQGINWSTPITPQGTITAQCGVRTVQGDIFSRSSRHQTFITAGLYKRCEFTSLQGGAAIDWLHDHSQLGSVDVRQMRCELSVRTFTNLEYGFLGGFDLFRDRPTTQGIDSYMNTLYQNSSGIWAVDVQDYYLLFVRKHLSSGGQVEFRCGATGRGDFLLSALGEAAITDRLAVNGGISVLAPSEGQSVFGNHRESWSMSLGVVLYFRGGALCRSANLYRPMFDVAGNNSLFTRIIRR